MAGITAAGVGSGIDIESLITQLMTAEKTPLTKLTSKKTSIQSKISLIGQFKNLITNLQTAASNLQNLGKVNGIKATVGNADAVSVTATNKASAATYSLDVLQLAKPQQMVSKDLLFTSTTSAVVSDSAVVSAEISFKFATGATQTVSVAATDGKITVQNVADAINAGDYGVKATLIKDKDESVRLALTSTDAGAKNAFTLDVAYLDAASNPATLTTTPVLAAGAGSTSFEVMGNGSAQDAKIKLNGVEITRASNSIADAVTGLTFDLKAVTTTSTTLTVSRDSSEISTQLKAFVDAYNQLASLVKSEAGYNATTKTAGDLQGDSTIRSMQNQLRSVMVGTFGDGTNANKTLSSLGVAFQRDGTLALDSDKLSKAVASDMDGVIEFLGAFDQTLSTVAPDSSKDGFAYQLVQLTKNMLADDGLFDAKIDGLNKSITDIEKQYERLESRLKQVEKRYRAQFTAMDTAVANMQNLGTYVTQLLNMTNSSSS